MPRVRAKKATASARPKRTTDSRGDPLYVFDTQAQADEFAKQLTPRAADLRAADADARTANPELGASRPDAPLTADLPLTGKLVEGKPQIRFRDRIVELRRVPASQLVDNAKNWRRHPDEQVSAMTSMLERIGFTGAIVAREREGKLEILDGHLRKGIAGGESVPVLIVDLTDQEASLMLATFDPLSDLALMDAKALRDLLLESEVEDEDAFLRKLLADVSEDLAAEMQSQTPKAKEVEGMALEPHEHYDYLVVLARTSHEWNVLCDRLGLKPEDGLGRRAKMGTARAIRATRLLEKLNAKA